jgi:hypothetical protein
MEVADTILIIRQKLSTASLLRTVYLYASINVLSKGNAMSKSLKQVRVPVSPYCRTAPASFIENVIGLMIILAMGLAIILAAEGEVLLGALMFCGGLVTFAAVTIARNAR